MFENKNGSGVESGLKKQSVIQMGRQNTDFELMAMTKSNYLIEGGFDVTLFEYLMIQASLYLVSQKNTKNEHYDANTRFALSIEDFCLIWGTDNKSGNISQRLKEVSISLKNKPLTIYCPEKLTYTHASWFSEVTPLKNGVIYFYFPPIIIQHLRNYRKKFTWYDLAQLRKLKRVYSIRFYELLSQHKYESYKDGDGNYVEKNEFEITVEELRHLFGLQNKYLKMGDFRKRVIDESLQELLEKLQMNIEVDTVKNGKTVQAFRFRYKFSQKELDYKSAFGLTTSDSFTTLETLNRMTDKTRKLFASKLVAHELFCLRFNTECKEISQFEKQVFRNLKKADFIEECYVYLLEVGYNENFKEDVNR